MDVLRSGRVERPAHEIREAFNVADILVLSVGAQPADRHVLDQSPAQRTDGLVGHWGLLSWVRSSTPRSQDRTPGSATPRDPCLATNYRGSGLVHRPFPDLRLGASAPLFRDPAEENKKGDKAGPTS